jgi:hypothetical protein
MPLVVLDLLVRVELGVVVVLRVVQVVVVLMLMLHVPWGSGPGLAGCRQGGRRAVAVVQRLREVGWVLGGLLRSLLLAPLLLLAVHGGRLGRVCGGRAIGRHGCGGWPLCTVGHDAEGRRPWRESESAEVEVEVEVVVVVVVAAEWTRLCGRDR